MHYITMYNHYLFHLKEAILQPTETPVSPPRLLPACHPKHNMSTTYMENNRLSCAAIKRPQIPEYSCSRPAGCHVGGLCEWAAELSSSSSSGEELKTPAQETCRGLRLSSKCRLLIRFLQYGSQTVRDELPLSD